MKMKTHSMFGNVLLILFLTFSVMIPYQANAASDDQFLSMIDWETIHTDLSENPTIDETVDGGNLTLTNNRGNPITFDNGIHVQPNTDIIYDVSSLEESFLTGWFGVDTSGNDDASVKLEIYTDDILAYESKWMTKNTPMEYVHVDFTNSKELTVSIQSEEALDNEDVSASFVETALYVNNPITVNETDIKDYGGMELIFNEEFDGDSLNRDVWDYETTPENGSHHYLNKVGKDENVWVEDGNLKLQVKPLENSDKYKTSSGAVSSQHKFDFKYGRVDVRAKIPTEQGMWPAIWMMATDQEYVWPSEGEIDIMELISQRPDTIWSTVHSGLDGQPDYYFNEGGTYTIDEGTFFDDYHVYSLDWQPDALRFYVDDILVKEITEWENWVIDKETGEIVEREQPAPFNQEFFLKLNVATGGNWAEDVDETTRYGERTTMNVDYVRVYQDEVQDYTYSTSNPFENGKQGPVWFAQTGNEGEWDNYESFDSGLKRWTTNMGNDSSFVSLHAINAYFNESSNYDTAAVAYQSPHSGYVKVGLNQDVEFDGKGQEAEADFQISKGNKNKSENVLQTKTLTNDSEEADARVYTEISADDFIRFEALKSREVIDNFDPIVEYIDKEEFDAYNRLLNKVTELEDLDTSEYPDSNVEKFDQALEDATTLINGSGDTSTYNDAEAALVAAYEQLDEIVVDTTILEKLLETAKQIDVTNKTEESTEVLLKEIKAAEALLEVDDVTQEEVDAQVDKLKAGIDQLVDEDEVEVPKSDKSDLEKAIEKAKSVDLENKTEKSIAQLEKALKVAEDVFADEAADQAEIDKVTKNLSKAITALEENEDKDRGDGSKGDSKDEKPSKDNGGQAPGSVDRPGTNNNASQNGGSVDAEGNSGQKLPKTATNTFNLLLGGVFIMLIGLFIIIRSKRKTA